MAISVVPSSVAPFLPTAIAVLLVLFSTIVSLLYVWIVWWMRDIERKCDCGATLQKHKALKNFVRFAPVVLLFVLVTQMVWQRNLWLSVFAFVTFMAWIGAAKAFVHEVREHRCRCADAKTLKVLDVLFYLVAALVTFAALTMLLLKFRII